ncbi:hypothetical protein NHF46_16185 [Arthrobacter alpinus]|nr:hypothetical protein [Arthrobacter alpinus]
MSITSASLPELLDIEEPAPLSLRESALREVALRDSALPEIAAPEIDLPELRPPLPNFCERWAATRPIRIWWTRPAE